MTPTQQKIIAHLENGPLDAFSLAKILGIRYVDVLRQIEELVLFKKVDIMNGKYSLRKEVVG